MHASIVKRALANHHIARDMNEHIQERGRINASIVISALASHGIARDMKKHIQE